MNDDYMSEADNEVDGGYFADLEYSYQQKEIRRQEDKENKAKKEENRKQQLLRQNKCIENLKIKINKLKQQLAEKDKEIEKLNKTLEMCKHIERYDIGEMFLENAKLIIEKRQFAIQKLEKVKTALKDKIKMMSNEEHCYQRKVVSWFDICDQINNQIKELKG